MKITARKAVNLIKATNGRIFTATFEKKDGTVRNMNCRTGVTSHLKGGELKYNPKDYGLMGVFDVQRKGYRMINVKTLTSLAIDGKVYRVKG